MSIPTGPVELPDVVARLAAGDDVEPVWRNNLGGLTFRLGADRYVKWAPAAATELDPTAEAERLAWARRWTVVPEVLGTGRDADGSWLLSAAIPGRSAVDPAWLAEPGTAARALGRGLRELHDALPVEECPFTWADDDRIEAADRRLAAGQGPESWFPEHRALGVAGARARLADRPAPDRLVVCHGDACAPNTLLGDTGAVVGHVDLGTLGVTDRWADLAVAAWSTEWNYGPGYDHLVYEGYGIDLDPERVAYYRLLWDLS